MRSKLIGIGLAALVMTATALGHHSASAIFDVTKPIEMTGTLTGVRWINPHIRLSMVRMIGEGQSEPWVFESQPPQWYRRVGVSRAVFEDAIGEPISIVGFIARNGEPFGILLSITFEDGTSFELVSDLGENQE